MPAVLSLADPVAAAWRGELRALLRLATPLVGANLLQMAVYAVDVVFVARLGPVPFAAATLGVFLFNVLLYALIGLTGAVAPIIAAERGRRTHAVREVRRSFRMAMWLGVIGAIPAVLLLAHGETVLRLVGQDPLVARRAGAFLDILLWGFVPGVAAGVMRSVAAALGRARWALGVTAMALVVGIAANWCLVFGHWGFPALGLEGSAIASVATLIAMMLAYAAILVVDPRLRRYRLFGRWWRPEWSRLREIMALGVPIALAWTFEGALFGGAAVLMGLIGVTEVAAHAIALNIAAIAFQLPFGVAQAATIRVGLAFGAGDRAAIACAGRVAIGLGVALMAGTALLIVSVPLVFVGLYVDTGVAANAAVVALALRYLKIAAVFQLLDGAQVVAGGVLRGIQDTRVPMVISGIGYWVGGFGTAWLLGFVAGWRGEGIWWGLAAGLAIVAALLLSRWQRRAALGLLPG